MPRTVFKAMALLLMLPVFALGQSRPVATAPTSQPTTADVQALIDAKEYPAAIKLASKLLSLRGVPAGGLSQFELTMLKGDAQAGQKLISAAVMTYKSASTQTPDPHEQALSRWTAELFHTANSTVYTPKMLGIARQNRGPFNLMNLDQRKQGFGALLEDDLSALDPKLKAASVSQSIVQIWPVLQQVVDLGQLDEIANGSDDKTAAIASGLLDHSRNLLTNLLKEYWARLGDIDQHANQTTTSQNQGFAANGVFITQSITRKNGLSDANVSELKDMIATAHKIHIAAEQLMKLSKNEKEWESILSDANRIAGRASDVLNTDYSDTSNQIGSGYNGGYGNATGLGSVGSSGGGYSHPSRPTSRPTRTLPTTRP